MHPFAPRRPAAPATRQLNDQLCAWLCAGHRLRRHQPAAQRRLAGRVRRPAGDPACHAARGEAHRNICLIPESAHGTNPASAQMAGMQVVVTKCDAIGNVDLADLRAKCEQHSARPGRGDDHLPSHLRRVRGAREGAVRAGAPARRPRLRRRRQHERAGRRGRAGRVRRRRQPPEPAQDLLHPARRRRARRRARCAWSRTWCPSCRRIARGSGSASTPVGAVSAAPLGNAAVLPISWMYMRMMGAEGLQRGHRDARSSAPTTSPRAWPTHYDIHYSGDIAGIKGGGVAHECILDLRPLQRQPAASAPRTWPSA